VLEVAVVGLVAAAHTEPVVVMDRLEMPLLLEGGLLELEE
jgi:hypothetical protein